MAVFDFLKMLEAEIKGARRFNAQTLAGNARAQVANTLQYFEADERCHRTGRELEHACGKLAALIREYDPLGVRDDEIDELTETALETAANFREECERCGLNSYGKAMGY